jgi:probable F420-dependent oxidoreductase
MTATYDQPTTEAARNRLGRVGVWAGAALNRTTATAAREAVAEIEELGYGSLWLSDTPSGKDPFSNAGVLLAATERIVLATGIANVWGRDAAATNSAARTLGEAFPSRFVLGLGVSHLPAVTGRGHTYERPLAKMRSYLEELDAAPYDAPQPPESVPRVLAALRVRMLELSRDRAHGAHPYFVPTNHTVVAREALGSGPLLVPEQAVVLETDPSRARAIAREHTTRYLGLANYVNNLRALGFSDDDVAGGGSDRLVDAVVAWGDVDAIRARVGEHLDAGADTVLIQPLPADTESTLDQLRELAPAVLR